ncbi:glycosyltransferase family 2 protein [Colwellia sp. BRX10-3]|uniref:glycosyltransferase family 2 protein n=1 Tax=Colwellia sp. BRX10-3 TaxID=2759844 RepID=UPI0015F44D78|nr:glycosyltransferase family 2 protein [Colwellia sp. BRX10-3]MBA6391082.1 glycosyltransferase family 2 protein [Colwellia sp. BRX10-3]
MKLSIVIPVYKSEHFVEKTVEEIITHVSKITDDYELILVNDGSPDDSWKVISELAKNINEVKAINLVKNYGQHTAVICGIEKSSGDYIITMDDDLQNPPSEIIKLVTKIEEGYDLVFAKFEEKKHASYRKIGTKIIDLLNKKVFDKPDNITLTNFRIFTQALAKRITKYRVNEPYIPGLLLMHASKIGNTLTKHAKRDNGESNYSLGKILLLVSRLLFNYSSYPLKLLSTIGAFIAILSFGWGMFMIIKQFFYGSNVQGWTTLIALLSFLNGFVILLLGVLGEYVIRISRTLSHDRAYHISEEIE